MRLKRMVAVVWHDCLAVRSDAAAFLCLRFRLHHDCSLPVDLLMETAVLSSILALRCSSQRLIYFPGLRVKRRT